MKPFVSNLYWIPKSFVNMKWVKKMFTHTLYEAQTDEEEDDVIELFTYKTIGGTKCVGLPKGSEARVRECLRPQFAKIKIKDKQSYNPVDFKLKFLGTFKDLQVKAIKGMTKGLEKRHCGVLNSGARTGKTLMGTQIALNLGQKTLIMAHQTDLIEQFCNETINDPKENLFNGNRLKKKEAGICRTYEDFKKYKICLVTYQTFISKGGQKLLKKICKMFGTIIIDEVHRSPADRYAEILSKFHAPYVVGLTATYDRKDGRISLSKMLLGDILYKTELQSMKAKVYGRDTLESGVYIGRPPKRWDTAMKFLFRNKQRNESIVKAVIRDVSKGHIVLIPTTLKEHQEELKGLLARELGADAIFLFNGSIPKKKRQDARDRMNKDKKIKVIIATRSMLTGLNIPRFSAIYTVVPISNNPNYEQEVKRVCTPMEGKRQPILRFFFDSTLPLSFGCYNTCKKYLTNGEYIVHKSFMQLGDLKVAKEKKEVIEENSVFRSPHSKSKMAKGRGHLF